MITTKENLRATATEAYFKGVQDGWHSGEAAGLSHGFVLADAKQRSDGRREGAALAIKFARDGIDAQIAHLENLVAVADTRWEKRLLTGWLEGLKAARQTVVSQA